MSKVQRTRARRSASEWRSIMARFERGGLTGTQFCRSESLSPSTFWRAAFVELADGPASPSVWEAELELGGGVVLRLRRC